MMYFVVVQLLLKKGSGKPVSTMMYACSARSYLPNSISVMKLTFRKTQENILYDVKNLKF